MWVQSLVREDTLEEEMATHSSILAWKSHGQRSLTGYTPWGHKESDTTEYSHTRSQNYTVIFCRRTASVRLNISPVHCKVRSHLNYSCATQKKLDW